ncbi:MAG: hypothetical protein ACTTH3_05930 [Schwartzia sp. (in: firmicutes)]
MAEEERQDPTEERERDDALVADADETAIDPPREDAPPMGDEEGESAGAASGTWDEADHAAKERDDAEAPEGEEIIAPEGAPQAGEEADLDPIAPTPDIIETGSDTTPPPGSADAPARSRTVRKPPTPRTPRPASLTPLCAAAAALLLLWGLHSVWTSWRLNAFCDDVQQAVSAPGGIGKLSSIRDWRVRDIGEGTLQVSRGDGTYTVYVWRLSGGGYLVDTIARRD